MSCVFRRYIDCVAHQAAEGRRPRAAGIREVAAAAGVSLTTVSHALNGMGRLSEATRQRVIDAAARLEYRANPSARNMRSAASGVIAVINQLSEGASFQASDLEFIMRLNQAICLAAWERDCYPTLLPPGAGAGFLGRIPLDGAILADPVRSDGTLHALDDLGIPVVTVGRDAACSPDRQWWADNDIEATTSGVLDHLAAAGAESVCLVSADTGQSYMTDAVNAYLRWCGERGASARLHVLASPFSAGDCFAAVSRECSGPRPADALYLVVEALVRPALDAVADAGLTVPGQVQVAVASDSAMARTGRLALTAVDLHPDDIGAAAVGLLASRLAGEPPRTAVVPASLVVRGSTRPVPAQPAATQLTPAQPTTGGTSR
jgi:DNA-binding LacI/PurR family transcriptional regulator